MTTIAQLRSGLAANISGGTTGFQVLDKWLSNPTPPTIDLKRGPVDYDHAMGRGLDEITFIVRALISDTNDEGAQVALDDLVAGANTLKDAIESDKTLGGAADYVHVASISDEKTYIAEQGTAYLGAEWTVVVGVNQS